MLFNTSTYLIFLPIVFALYWMVKTAKAQNWVIVLASMVFYGWWSLPCLGLMVGTCLFNYVFILAMQRSTRRTPWLVAALVLNFGVLGVFKYFNFFADNLALLLHSIHLQADLPTLQLILPVGISFYTFQLSGYVIDNWREGQQTTDNGQRTTDNGQQNIPLAPRPLPLTSFLAFITFFPQLVAGPIERGSHLLPQFSYRRHFHEPDATEGMRLLLWGLLKKMLVADYCASQVNQIFAHYHDASLTTLWLGALYFTFQIYGDFSGYSDMAVGSAKLLGIHISQNFNKPYFATSMPDFWRRWHITLMGWFKDYVYIPLGGNRKGRVRTQLNMLTVFLLSGLWHGSNWTFVIWGLYHALIYRLPVKWFALLFVLIGWVFFRAENIEMAWGYLSGMFNPSLWHLPLLCSRSPLLPITLLVVTEWRMKNAPHPFQWRDHGWQSSQWVRLTCYLLLFLATYLWGGVQTNFIYFQF